MRIAKGIPKRVSQKDPNEIVEEISIENPTRIYKEISKKICILRGFPKELLAKFNSKFRTVFLQPMREKFLKNAEGLLKGNLKQFLKTFSKELMKEYLNLLLKDLYKKS